MLRPLHPATASTLLWAITLCNLEDLGNLEALRRNIKSRERREGNQALRMYDMERSVKNFLDLSEFKEEDKKGIDAWRLWNEEKALDLMDRTLVESCNRGEVLKCINVGFLCVQEDPSDRPNVSNVLSMLTSEAATPLPNPKGPAFVAKKWISSGPSSSFGKPETSSSYNELTVSTEPGR
ncbi:hypothetical protein HYC85_013318 [Camellia sinensis]|uniref:S-locus receptor kinase C-terminal domain-containing protein n=1 Tax=Camellia sinensis TaxID=4442 RepID=A0A7J7H557_CAMSI|nr:hypothetical protein HYC85_013318 [Camellia sinensis]